MKRQSGFTLIELMISIAIIGIIMAFAVPSLSDFWDKKRLIAGAEAVYSEYQFARSEAISRSADVNVNFSRTNNTTWSYGTSTDSACDSTISVIAAGNGACYLVVDDGDGTVDDGTGTIDLGDLVLRRFDSTGFTGVNLISVSATAVTFNSVRGTANGTTVRMQSDAGKEIQVRVGPIGRVKICSPTGTTKVSGYADC